MANSQRGPVKSFIRDLRHKSIWQVLGTYLLASWGVLAVVDTMAGALNLPDWFPTVALGFLVLGFPFVLATAFFQVRDSNQQSQFLEASPAVDTEDSPHDLPASSTPFTWKKAMLGAVGAFALWGLLAAGWLLFGSGGSFGGSGSASIALSAVSDVEEAIDAGNWLEAYDLAKALPPQVPDSVRQEIFTSASAVTNITSTPEGASVFWRPYGRSDIEGELIGTTPLVWPAPRTGISIQIELDGYASQTLGLMRGGNRSVALRALGSDNENALYMSARNLSPVMVDARLTFNVPPRIGDFLIDRYEVTNREFQEFVDADGYENQDLWVYSLERDGVEVTWADAMREFVDRTGRPGPSVWTAGRYPEGQEDHPVTGISWYEAAAYAEFVGRDLPSVYHWYLMSTQSMAEWILPLSNLEGDGLAPVGESGGVTGTGLYDMAGNAREWLVNKVGNLRVTVGGGWNDPPYRFSLSQEEPPFDRSETNGFRLITNLGDPATFSITKQSIELTVRDFYSETPASDELFAEFVRVYQYDDLPLNGQVESVDTLPIGIRERITFDAGYDGERMVLYLFRPLEAVGPLQTIVYWPGAGALSQTEFEGASNGNNSILMILRSGRAFAWPILQSTFERQDGYGFRMQDESNDHREHVLQWNQDLRRSLDYLETREEIDSSRFGYLGFSWGGLNAPIALAIEDRFKVAVLGVPGLLPMATQPVADAFNFLPRVTVPVLMMNGEYDQIFPLETSGKPFFDFLGTDEADKKLFIAPGGHTLPIIDLTRETLDWLDRYLGEVR